jgi:hypothetical protein
MKKGNAILAIFGMPSSCRFLLLFLASNKMRYLGTFAFLELSFVMRRQYAALTEDSNFSSV